MYISKFTSYCSPHELSSSRIAFVRLTSHKCWPLPFLLKRITIHQIPTLVSCPIWIFRFNLVLPCLTFLPLALLVQDTFNGFQSYISFIFHASVQVSELVRFSYTPFSWLIGLFSSFKSQLTCILREAFPGHVEFFFFKSLSYLFCSLPPLSTRI